MFGYVHASHIRVYPPLSNPYQPDWIAERGAAAGTCYFDLR